MDHVLRVRGSEPPARGEEELQHLVAARAPRREALPEGGALDELHGDEDAVIHEPGVVHRDHVGMGESGHGPLLSQQARLAVRTLRVRERVVADDLQRHLPLQLAVMRREDNAHPARAQAMEEDIALEPGGKARPGRHHPISRAGRPHHQRERLKAGRALVQVRLRGRQRRGGEPTVGELEQRLGAALLSPDPGPGVLKKAFGDYASPGSGPVQKRGSPNELTFTPIPWQSEVSRLLCETPL